MQVSYFSSQYSNCMNSTGAPFYWWTMGQILAVYMGLAIVICHFFRKFCQDPALEEEQAQKDKELAEQMAEKQAKASVAEDDA